MIMCTHDPHHTPSRRDSQNAMSDANDSNQGMRNLTQQLHQTYKIKSSFRHSIVN